MSGLARLNRELMRLDGALRSSSVDREQYRAQRRRLLLDFEERQITTAPGAQDAGDITEPAATPAPASPAPRPAQVQAPSKPQPSAAARASNGAPLGKIVVAVLVTAPLLLAAWWMLGSGVDRDRTPTARHADDPAVQRAGDLPQDVAARLMQSAWAPSDLADFRARWAQLAPETVRAASDDPRIWLLRGETDRRVREAREAASIANTPESQQLVVQLEQIQAAIRPN